MDREEFLGFAYLVLGGGGLFLCGASLLLISINGSVFGYQPTYQSASAYGIFSIALGVFVRIWSR